MKTRKEIITPEKAREYLNANTHNRAVRPKRVALYVREILAGRFLCTHQGIAFFEDGALADGQHRLLAIMQAGVAVEMQVTRELPKGAADLIDGQKGRTLADHLRLNHGVEHAQWISAVVREIIALAAPSAIGCPTTPHQAQDILALYGREIADVRTRIWEYVPGRRAAVAAVLAFAAASYPAEVAAFAAALGSGEALSRGTPAFTLRNYLIARTGAKGGERAKLREWVANALYHHVNGNALTIVKSGPMGLDFFKSKQRGNVEKIRQAAAAGVEEEHDPRVDECEEMRRLLIEIAGETSHDKVFTRRDLLVAAKRLRLLSSLGVDRLNGTVPIDVDKRFGRQLQHARGVQLTDRHGRRFVVGHRRQKHGATYPLTFLEGTA